MPACPNCGFENQPGNQFCISCGTMFTQETAPATPPAETPAEVPDELAPDAALSDAGKVCPACDTYNEKGQKKCIRCGQPLSGLTSFFKVMTSDTDAQPEEPPPSTPLEEEVTRPAAPPSEPHAVGAQGDASPEPASPEEAPPPTPLEAEETQPAGRPMETRPDMPAATIPPEAKEPVEAPSSRTPTGQMPAAVAQEPTSEICPFCQARIPVSAPRCLACGKPLRPTPQEASPSQETSVRLRLVRGFGREDTTFPIGPTGVTIGRTQSLINIAEDPFLAPVHLVMRLKDGRLTVEDPGSFNGVFLRIRGKVEIRQGTEFILGTQRLIVLGLGGPTTDGRTPTAGETRPYGGPVPRQLFIALRALHAGDERMVIGGHVLLRSGPSVTIGQQGCDINFPFDNRMAPRQAELLVRPSGLEIQDLGSPSGVFVRLYAPVALQDGDELLAGEELFRVEMG